jgi:hypothetical protein
MMAFLDDAALRWDALKALLASSDRNIRFLGDLISGQNRAAQQGKTENLSFNELVHTRIDEMRQTHTLLR